MTTICPGDIIARADALDECVKLGDYAGFHTELLDLCKDASEELKQKQFKFEALVLHGEFTQLKTKSRTRMISEDDFGMQTRRILFQGLELKEEVVAAYHSKAPQ
ncbi:hypothetical protein [Yoonia sp. SS1-5]|uniref:Uncharacterized protein n=1 Tax=Yoonia rhodophyticola TaxID=3137370 RepID=A0AAN0MFN0_9RHOB